MISLIPIGFFREVEYGHPKGPSLKELRRSDPDPKQNQILAYLNSGKLLVFCPGVVRDFFSQSGEVMSSPSIVTDGVYAWPKYLAFYVENYHVTLPSSFINHASHQNWHVNNDIDVTNCDIDFEMFLS